MKKNIFLYSLPMLFTLFLASSCEKVNLHEGITFEKGLLNFQIEVPGQPAQYNATVAGPYNDGDTIYIKVPTTDEDPLDVTKLKPLASLENNSEIKPGLPGLADFTNPMEISVVDGSGNTKRYIVKVVPTLPRTVFKSLWFKTASTLGVLRTNISGLTVAGDNLLVADYNGGNMGADAGVRVFDKVTGDYKKIIAPPTTFCMQVVADDAGHFVMNRYNVYGAGFMVYYYEDVDSAPQLILNYTNAAGCPADLGKKMSVIGNLKQGKAYVYATTANNNNCYYWEFNDGVPVDVLPTVIKYTNATPWNFATIKRKSLDANSDHYITYCNYVSPDANLEKGSRFASFTPDMDVTEMNTQNHYYKILDFEVFNIGGTVFMAALTQGYFAWDATHIKVYDITDPAKMKLVPGSAGYDDFMLFTSPMYGGTNYNRYGDVAVDVKGNDITVYATMATNDATTAGVMAYKMKFNP
ncbi:hypothetical protein [Chitinophaga sp. MM2321]|uniref:hypothetical protein n=1 Tax=Chitinophaga sp. MM2321 TaxID=3137178 RepID=UPI0032D5A2F2